MNMTRTGKIVLLVLVFCIPAGMQFLHAQLPPPPPPPNGPPCWPPPCVPVDGGIVAAVGAAAVFGGRKLMQHFKSKVA